MALASPGIGNIRKKDRFNKIWSAEPKLVFMSDWDEFAFFCGTLIKERLLRNCANVITKKDEFSKYITQNITYI